MIESGLERMKAVAEMLGVELGEEFDIGESPFNPYEITEDGLIDRNGNVTSIALKDLLVGVNTITKRPNVPWRPKRGELYWYVIPGGIVKATTYAPKTWDKDAINYGIGNCFPDRNTAEANRDIMLEKFKTREITPASWTPEHGEWYWRVYDDGITDLTWGGNLEDYTSKATGNLYRTEAEALADYPNLRKRLGMPEVDA